MIALQGAVFNLEFQIAYKLQDINYQTDRLIDYRNRLVESMTGKVKELNRENFAVRQHIKYVDLYSSESNYQALTYDSYYKYSHHHEINLIWLILTLVWFTIAYCIVVSICECPNIFCTCSIGIPLSIARVAMVLRNLCGCILLRLRLPPNCRIRISTPLIFNLSYGESNVTNNAGLLSFLLAI